MTAGRETILRGKRTFGSRKRAIETEEIRILYAKEKYLTKKELIVREILTRAGFEGRKYVEVHYKLMRINILDLEAIKKVMVCVQK